MTNASLPQPLPEINERTPVIFQVVSDLYERAQAGEKKYGVMLQPKNGRDALWDAYQEALDLAMYLRQAILERNEDTECPPI